jgi:hypothetical protein
VLHVIRNLISSAGTATRYHLRTLADAYTLLAFFRETGDVQRAVKKLFSHGKIWLDTSIVLPLIAESLMGDELMLAEKEKGGGQKPGGTYTRMIMAAREVGMNLCVTQGVLEEVERHFNRCLA